jgi:hypothetical protein
MAAISPQLTKFVLGLVFILCAERFVNSDAFYALVKPDRTMAIIVVSPLPMLGTTLFMSAIKAKHVCILYHYLVTDK